MNQASSRRFVEPRARFSRTTPCENAGVPPDPTFTSHRGAGASSVKLNLIVISSAPKPRRPRFARQLSMSVTVFGDPPAPAYSSNEYLRPNPRRSTARAIRKFCTSGAQVENHPIAGSQGYSIVVHRQAVGAAVGIVRDGPSKMLSVPACSPRAR